MNHWIVITARFSSDCHVCGGTVENGDTAYWKKNIGIKHYPECSTMPKDDDSRLIVIEPDDEFYLSDARGGD